MNDINSIIINTINRIIEEQAIETKGELNNESILLETGLDSLGFAILVSELEGELGYDPFVLMDTPVYPQTLGEFLSIYQAYSSHRVSN